MHIGYNGLQNVTIINGLVSHDLLSCLIHFYVIVRLALFSALCLKFLSKLNAFLPRFTTDSCQEDKNKHF